jgi:hypothetical protein
MPAFSQWSELIANKMQQKEPDSQKETTCRTGNNQEPFNQSSCCSVNAIPVAFFFVIHN